MWPSGLVCVRAGWAQQIVRVLLRATCTHSRAAALPRAGDTADSDTDQMGTFMLYWGIVGPVTVMAAGARAPALRVPVLCVRGRFGVRVGGRATCDACCVRAPEHPREVPLFECCLVLV